MKLKLHMLLTAFILLIGLNATAQNIGGLFEEDEFSFGFHAQLGSNFIRGTPITNHFKEFPMNTQLVNSFFFEGGGNFRMGDRLDVQLGLQLHSMSYTYDGEWITPGGGPPSGDASIPDISANFNLFVLAPYLRALYIVDDNDFFSLWAGGGVQYMTNFDLDLLLINFIVEIRVPITDRFYTGINLGGSLLPSKSLASGDLFAYSLGLSFGF